MTILSLQLSRHCLNIFLSWGWPSKGSRSWAWIGTLEETEVGGELQDWGSGFIGILTIATHVVLARARLLC